MQNLDVATREIMWNIPFSFKVTMYVMLVVATGIFIYGFYKKYVYLTNSQGFKSLKGKSGLFPEKLNWKQFLETIFFTGKVTRATNVGIFHSLIFYGFVILWIATDLVAIHADTPFQIYKGWTYIIVSFLADFAGLAILIGVGFAFHRRYIKKPDYLSATKPKQELFMYAILVALVVIGFIIEGYRILGTGMPEREARWSPIGYALATFLQTFSMSEATLSGTYKTLWMLHMANTMVFLAAIPFSKFSHIFLLPVSALLTPLRRGAVLEPMDFEDETAETFGLGKFSEMTAKNKLDLITCVECGRCSQVCPALQSGKILDPKTIITKARDLVESAQNEKKADVDFWENPIYQDNEIDACTTCGACMEECPANIEHVDIILEAKRYKTLTLGQIPPQAADAANKIRVQGNPWGISQEDRFKWADGLEVPVIEEGKKVDYLYYIGCAGSYDSANQQVVKDTVNLLKKAGVDFAVMGKTEKCNGDPVRRFGDEYTFTEIAIENIANMNQYDFDKVVTHCPHCLHTIGKEYAKFENGSFETVHHTELLWDLIRTGKLKTDKAIDKEMTFHDPCYLGRHHGEYDAPREILKSIPGVKLKEMERSKDKSLCCGMGGGNMWYELPEGEHMAKNRLRDIGETKSPQLATSCSYCLINFNSTKTQVSETEELEIEDVASILSKSVL